MRKGRTSTVFLYAKTIRKQNSEDATDGAGLNRLTLPTLRTTMNCMTRAASKWSIAVSTLACGARGPRIESLCEQKFVFSRKSLRYAALGTGCTLPAVSRSTQPSTLRGMLNEYQPYGCVIIHE